MLNKIKIGDRVNYNNLVCIVTDIEYSGSSEYLEIRPVGSSAKVTVDSKSVTKIMNEGSSDTRVGGPLFD